MQEKLIKQNKKALEDAILARTSRLANGSRALVHPLPSGGHKRTYEEAITEPSAYERGHFRTGALPQQKHESFMPKRSNLDPKRLKEELRSSISPLSYQEKCSKYLATMQERSPPLHHDQDTPNFSLSDHEPFPTSTIANNPRLEDPPEISDVPLDLCTSPKNSNLDSPGSKSPTLAHASDAETLEQNRKKKVIEEADDVKRKSPELFLAAEQKSNDGQEDEENNSEVKTPFKRLTGRKSIDRKPSPIDLSRSTRTDIDGEADGFHASLLSQFPSLRGISSSFASCDGRSINTPDVVGRKTPSDTTASFFPSSMVMTPSPMVSDVETLHVSNNHQKFCEIALKVYLTFCFLYIFD